jgi:RND family efflux transporter MFP subunit
MRRLLQIVLPLLVIGGTAGIAKWLFENKREVKPQPRVEVAPLVEVRMIKPGPHQFHLHAQGEVAARNEIELITEVSGKVTWVADAFANGGFFSENEPLVRLDQRDFQLAVTQTTAALAKAKVGLQREVAEAQVARKEWESLGQGNANPLLLREPQLAEARANVASNEAALEKANLDLSRCEILAPYDGRVRHKQADVGQFINRGSRLGRIYAVDYVEIRLPLPLDELRFLDLPLGLQPASGKPGPETTLFSELGNDEASSWTGNLVRTEGEINTQTRMLTAVILVKDPYGLRSGDDQKPLPVGMFVQARIKGRTIDDVYRVPRSAIRGKDRLLVVDGEDRLRLREVKVLRALPEDMLLKSGLEEGDRVCLSLVDAPVDGMKVLIRDVAADQHPVSP